MKGKFYIINIVKKVPTDIYLIYCPILFIIIISIISFPGFVHNFIDSLKNPATFVFIKNGAGLEKMIWILFAIGFIGKILYKKYFSLNKLNGIKIYIKEILEIFYTLVIPGLFYGEFTLYIFTQASVKATIYYSLLFSQWDRNLFGTDLYFAIHPFLSKIPFFEKATLFSYNELLTAISIFIILLFFLKKEKFRKFLATYFFIIFISMMFWIKFPAIAPAHMFIDNLFMIQMSPEMKTKVDNDRPSQFLSMVLELERKEWIDPSYNMIAISTNPSMHVAWAILLCYYIFLLAPNIIIRSASLIYTILNIIGAVYIGQHYGVDVIGGILVFIFCIYIVEKIFNTNISS